MSDRLDFYEVRCGTPSDWTHVCLCKDEDVAKQIVSKYNLPCFVEHVEIVAEVDLCIGDY